MKTFFSVVAACVLAASLAGCGTLVGAGLGAATGHVLTDGSTVGTLGGAALGGAIGSR